jgi:hypothetical protein
MLYREGQRPYSQSEIMVCWLYCTTNSLLLELSLFSLSLELWAGCSSLAIFNRLVGYALRSII